MGRRTRYLLLSATMLFGTAISAQRNKFTRPPTTSAPTRSPTPPPAREISARASDVRPPLLNLTKIKNPRVSYVPIFQLKKYPIPAVVFLREGLANAEDRRKIKERIIYPAINKSDKPIAAIVVEFYRERTEIGVTLIWHEAGLTDSVDYASALISRNKAGHFDLDACLRLLRDEDD